MDKMEGTGRGGIGAGPGRAAAEAGSRLGRGGPKSWSQFRSRVSGSSGASNRWFAEGTAAGGLNGSEVWPQSHKVQRLFLLGCAQGGQFVVIQPRVCFQGNRLAWDVTEVTQWQSWTTGKTFSNWTDLP